MGFSSSGLVDPDHMLGDINGDGCATAGDDCQLLGGLSRREFDLTPVQWWRSVDDTIKLTEKRLRCDQLGIRVTTRAGVFYVTGAAYSFDHPRDESGYVALWYSGDEQLVYVFDRLLFDTGDVGHALVTLCDAFHLSLERFTQAGPYIEHVVGLSLGEATDATPWKIAYRGGVAELMGYEATDVSDADLAIGDADGDGLVPMDEVCLEWIQPDYATALETGLSYMVVDSLLEIGGVASGDDVVNGFDCPRFCAYGCCGDPCAASCRDYSAKCMAGCKDVDRICCEGPCISGCHDPVARCDADCPALDDPCCNTPCNEGCSDFWYQCGTACSESETCCADACDSACEIHAAKCDAGCPGLSQICCDSPCDDGCVTRMAACDVGCEGIDEACCDDPMCLKGCAHEPCCADAECCGDPCCQDADLCPATAVEDEPDLPEVVANPCEPGEFGVLVTDCCSIGGEGCGEDTGIEELVPFVPSPDDPTGADHPDQEPAPDSLPTTTSPKGKMTYAQFHDPCLKTADKAGQRTTPDTGDPAEADPVYFHSGEFYQEVIDLRIPGRGFDFVLKRKYRSKLGRATLMGHGWDFSYNMYLIEDWDGADCDLIFHDGTGRIDRFIDIGDGHWGRAEYARTITYDAASLAYVMTFDNLAEWRFKRQGTHYRLTTMTDRNGNTMSLAYDGIGRLICVRDTLNEEGVDNRAIHFAYVDVDPGPGTLWRLSTVTDFVGRVIQYAYYDGTDGEGNLGDLKSVTYPPVVSDAHHDIPAGHEYPAGKTWRYTYSTGFDEEALNHNLLTITDARGATYLQNIYAGQTSPEGFMFDRIVAQIYGEDADGVSMTGNDRFDFTYYEGAGLGDARRTRVVINNRGGHVRELFFDHRNRLTKRRIYMGTAPDPADHTDIDWSGLIIHNGPVNPLRADEPKYYESRYWYTYDSRLLAVLYPNGSRTEYVYEGVVDEHWRPITPQMPPRTRSGAVRMVVHQPANAQEGGEPIVERMRYADVGGCGCGQFVETHIDPRLNTTSQTFDGFGNVLTRTHRNGAVEGWVYNDHGQVTAHILPPTDHDNDPATPPYARRDEYHYYESGPARGYLWRVIADVHGEALVTSYEYNAVGKVVATTDPKGNRASFVYDQHGNLVTSRSRPVGDLGDEVSYEQVYFYDANNNLVRADVQNVDEHNQVDPNAYLTRITEYDVLGYPVRTCSEKGTFTDPLIRDPHTGAFACDDVDEDAFVYGAVSYNANKNIVEVTPGEAASPNPSQPNGRTRVVYDARQLPFTVTLGAGGDDQNISRIDYNANRDPVCIQRGYLTDQVQTTTITYDDFGRAIGATDAEGNVVDITYDANNNPTHIKAYGELIDGQGTANVRLFEHIRTYNASDQMTVGRTRWFDPAKQDPIDDGTQRTFVAYNALGAPVTIVSDTGGMTSIAYDTVGRRKRVADTMGNETVFVYDANSNVTRVTDVECAEAHDFSDRCLGFEQFVTDYAYDQLDRLIETVEDPGGVALRSTFAYDSRGNLVYTTSPKGEAYATRTAYDGLGRVLGVVKNMRGGSAEWDDGRDIVMENVWDDNHRLIAQIDNAGNATRYEYDDLDRLIRLVRPDGSKHAYRYDVHGNLKDTIDANGTKVFYQYDRLNRLTRKDITPGIGVSRSTTFESFAYDGMSRPVLAEDDDSRISSAYDSLGNAQVETLRIGTPDDATTGRLVFAYDGVGNPTATTYPGGRLIEQTFDLLGRTKKILDVDGLDYALVATYGYAGTGRVRQRTLGNGTQLNVVYDGLDGVANRPGDFGVGQVARTTHTWVDSGQVIDDRAYTWDRHGNKTSRFDHRTQITHSYAYDQADRLGGVGGVGVRNPSC